MTAPSRRARTCRPRPRGTYRRARWACATRGAVRGVVGGGQARLAEEFRQAQLEVCARLRSETPYDPGRVERAVHGFTGEQAVALTRYLVVDGGEEATGFWQLHELGRPEATIEALVVDPRWSDLFDPVTIEAARWRLDLVDRG